LIVGLVPVFHSQVIIFKVNINVWEDHSFSDLVPDDACHFISVHLNDRLGDRDAASARGGAGQAALGDFGKHSKKNVKLTKKISKNISDNKKIRAKINSEKKINKIRFFFSLDSIFTTQFTSGDVQ